VGARLEKLLDETGVRLLHDCRVPGHGQANIDHIAVGPGGITVIDAKTHRGKLRRDWEGGLFSERRAILRINGRDQTKLITGVEKQTGYIRAALAKLNLGQEIEVRGALCFPNVDGLPLSATSASPDRPARMIAFVCSAASERTIPWPRVRSSARDSPATALGTDH
jgi:Nuclease-related domain